MPYLVSYSMTKVLPEIEAYGNMKWPTVAKKTGWPFLKVYMVTT